VFLRSGQWRWIRHGLRRQTLRAVSATAFRFLSLKRTGIGLATVQRIISRHGAVSGPSQRLEKARPSSSPWRRPNDGPRTTIFLVRDNDDDAELAVMAFDSPPYVNPLVRARDVSRPRLSVRAREVRKRRDVSELLLCLLDIRASLPKLSGLGSSQAIRADDVQTSSHRYFLLLSNEDRDRLAHTITSRTVMC